MAGKKTQAQLTPEEKLQQAIVPEAEQPYKVPANWCWAKAGSFFYILRGVSYKKHQVHTKKEMNDCLIMRGGNVLEGEIDLESDNVYVDKSLVDDIQLLRKNDVVIVSSTGSTKIIGKAGIVDKDYFDVSFGAFLTLLRPIDDINKTFVDFYFQSELYRARVRLLANGVNINNIRNEHLSGASFPLPPLAEQQRIVERIESLFAKLDEAKENLQNVLDGFETRKAAILHKAFTGELTANWRKQHGVSMDSWEEKCVSEICKNLKYGTSKKSKLNGLVAVIRMGNLQNGEIDWNNLAYTDDEEDIKKYSLKKGDVLFNRTNSPELVGKTAIYRGEFPAIYAGYLIKLDYNENIINGEYFNYLMNSIRAKEYCQLVKTDGVSQSNINAKKIGAFQIPVPKLEEQTEIVRIIDGLFAKEQQAKELAENALAKVDLIKKAILAHAFRGQLATNNPADEPALKLLERVL